MSLAAGKLRDRVTIQEPNLVDNGRGGRRPPSGEAAWRTVKSDVAAEVKQLRGDEALSNLVQRSRQLWRVTIRRGHQISTGMRLIWNDPVTGQVLGDIKSAALNDARDGIVMTVESGGKG